MNLTGPSLRPWGSGDWGSVLNVKCHKSNSWRQYCGGSKALVLCPEGPSLALFHLCLLFLHVIVVLFFFFSFCCTPELMLLDLAIVFIWDGTTGAPVAHGSWLMSGTALYYMVWCGWAAHSESIFCTRVSFCCLWLPFIDVNSNSICIWVLIISVLSSYHAHLSQDYGAGFIFLFVVFLFLKSRLCWSFQLNYKNTV